MATVKRRGQEERLPSFNYDSQFSYLRIRESDNEGANASCEESLPRNVDSLHLPLLS
jgi:hypothetical protein